MVKNQKVKLLFDSKVLNSGLNRDTSRAGIFVVAINIFTWLLTNSKIELYLLSDADSKKSLSEFLRTQLKDEFLESRILTQKDDFSDIDSFISPMYAIPEFVLKDYPHITCFTVLHDIIPYLYPHYFGEPSISWFEDLIRGINPNHFYFSVSESTKNDFVKYIDSIDERTITTAYLAANESFHQVDDVEKYLSVKEKYGLPKDKKYLFSLCTLEDRKNLIRAVEAFILFVERNGIDDLVYVLGGGTFDVFIQKLENRIPKYEQYKDKIIRIGYVDDDDLSVLYSNAEWFVYTSIYEGFGLPPLEAMQCGCPVITSDSSSIPEVVGDAAITICSEDTEQHIKAYHDFYFNPDLRKEYSRKGVLRSTQFSWEKCTDTIANKILEIESKKEKKTLVSIVTVVFNAISNGREKTIKTCIESVKAQSYPNVEHLVIDGGSTDGTQSLLQEYVDRGEILLLSEPDKGVYDAMNKGINIAKGKYVNFLNSDDYFHSERAIEYSVEFLEKNDADYSFADTRVIKRSGRKEMWHGDIKKLLFGVHYCHQTMFVKTDVLKALGGFDLSYKVSSDSDLMIRLFAKGYRHVYVPFCFLSYKIGGFSLENKEQSRIDHSGSFFRHIGEGIGLNAQDCFLLWQIRFFDEVDIQKQIELVSKVPLKYGGDFLMRESIMRISNRQGECLENKSAYLFGFIPLVKRVAKKNKLYYMLFNIIRIFKIVEYSNKKKYFLFGFFPVLKVKYSISK